MKNVPRISYRFGDSWYITSFITPDNPDILAVVDRFNLNNGDAFIEAIANYIRDEFQYPLIGDQPSCDGQILRYAQGLFKHLYKSCKYYVWGWPAEVLQSHYGYCAETANLGTSILLNKIPQTVTVLGAVLDLNGQVLGYHAWCELPYNAESTVFETTIHTLGAHNLATAQSVYDKNSDWAKQGGVFYEALARYNDTQFSGDTAIVSRMCLPAKYEATWHMSQKKLARKYYSEHTKMVKSIRQAWGA